MQAMNIAHCLFLTTLASLTLLPQGCGEEPPVVPPDASQEAQMAPATPAPSPHPVFDHWQAVLTKQSTPEAFYSCTAGEVLSAEEQEELAEVKRLVATALKTAIELYKTRHNLFSEAMHMPGLGLLDEADVDDEDAELKSLLAPFEALLAEGFRRDLEALSFCSGWLEAGSVEPGLRPGRHELLFRPTAEALAFEQVDGCNAEIDGAFASLNEDWKKRQDLAMSHFLSAYAEIDSISTLSSLRDPITGQYWQEDGADGQLTKATMLYRRCMQALLRAEQQVWERYRDAMLALVCPSQSYQGSGTGIFMSDYECYLLDSRERFICMLTVGTHGIDKLHHLAIERGAELTELHRRHRFGEIFISSATLFRHPKLEGHPWCIRFSEQGAGFIFVSDGPVLRAYAAEHPDGGELKVRGYQSIEQTGTPYEAENDVNDYGENLPKEHPAGGLQLRQVFYLLSVIEPEDEVDEVEEATQPRGCTIP